MSCISGQHDTVQLLVSQYSTIQLVMVRLPQYSNSSKSFKCEMNFIRLLHFVRFFLHYQNKKMNQKNHCFSKRAEAPPASLTEGQRCLGPPASCIYPSEHSLHLLILFRVPRVLESMLCIGKWQCERHTLFYSLWLFSWKPQLLDKFIGTSANYWI